MFQLLDSKAHARTVTNLAASSRFLSAVGLNPVDAGTPIGYLPQPTDSPKPLAPDLAMLERNLELEDAQKPEPVKPLLPSVPLLGDRHHQEEVLAVSCPACLTQLKVELEQLEQEGPCPRCAAILEVGREENGEVRVRAYRHD